MRPKAARDHPVDRCLDELDRASAWFRVQCAESHASRVEVAKVRRAAGRRPLLTRISGPGHARLMLARGPSGVVMSQGEAMQTVPAPARAPISSARFLHVIRALRAQNRPHRRPACASASAQGRGPKSPCWPAHTSAFPPTDAKIHQILLKPRATPGRLAAH